MKNLFSDDNSGYRLKTLQILNWGVFDEKVKTFEFNNKSTILTGYNGSGKTTCVDAILTLLIPTNLRWYNLSSENVKKRERDVENYVRGAYGNTGDSGTNYLREKDTISIINGIFNDPVNERSLSLLQVRYFVGDKLDTKYAITEKELRFEKANLIINSRGATISSDGKWRKILTEEFNTRFFESFSSYKTFFIDKFGFLSENALKLFSQTVGMKVLGDMTTFVRTYMLEDKTPEKEFNELDSLFANLLNIDRDLRKAQLKLEKLEKIHASIEKWKKADEEKRIAELNRIGEELWFCKNATEYGEKEVLDKERKREELEERRTRCIDEIERIEEIIFALSQDTSTSYLDSLERTIKELRVQLSDTATRYNQYTKIITKLNDNGAGLSVPTSRETFYSLKDNIPILEKKISSKIDDLEEKINKYNIEINEANKCIKEYEKELEYLSNRETNIPKEYDDLRLDIASSLSFDPLSLPYFGELITIDEDSGEWKTPLIKLLNAHALDLLVSKDNEKKVAEYLDSNDVGLDIKMIVVEDELFYEEKDNPFSDSIIIREKNNPYQKWLKNHLADICNLDKALNLNELFNKERAILPSSLIKDEDRLIKYDEKGNNGLFKNHLGWDNKKKREDLSNSILGKEQEREDFEKNLKKHRFNKTRYTTVLNDLSRLNDYDDWTTLDTKPIEKALYENEEKKKEFLENNKDIYEKKRQLEEAKRQKNQLNQEKDEILKEEGKLETSLKKIKEDTLRLRDNLNKIEWNDEAYNSFIFSYKSNISVSSFSDVNNAHQRLNSIVEDEKNRTKEVEVNYRNTLERQMENFINPSLNSVTSELNWSGDYPDLVPNAESAEDYETEYLKIKDEDILNLKQKFNEYLTSSLIKNLAQLKEKITSWNNEITDAIRILNRNLSKIPFDKETNSHIQLEIRNSNDRDHLEFSKTLNNVVPNFRYYNESEKINYEVYEKIKSFLDKYRSDDNLRKKVLDVRRKYVFSAKEIDGDGTVTRYYKDTGALSGGEKAKLTYTILAASIAYQFKLDDNSDSNKGPFRFVILDEAFSKSDARNSEYALQLFKELDLQLMVVTPRNGINIVEGYVSTLHLLEKNSNNTSSLSSMTIEEYKEGQSASIQ